jgi:MSHA biogenesis protein MshI
LLNFLRKRQHSEVLLTISLHSESVGLAVAKRKNDVIECIASDTQAVMAKNYPDAIQQLINKYARFSKGDPALVLVLGASLYQSVTLERPKLPAEEIAAGLRYSLRDLVNLAPHDIIADYYDLPVQLPGQDKIVAVIADRQLLLPVLECVHKITTNLLAVTAEEQAVAQLFNSQSDPAVVAYRAPGQVALMQVYREGVLQVNRTVRTLDSVSELSIEEINMGGLQPLSVEVQRSADYFERQLRQRPVKQVILAFRQSQKSAVAEQLTTDLGLDVRWADYPVWAQELAIGDYSDFPLLGGVMLGYELQEVDA